MGEFVRAFFRASLALFLTYLICTVHIVEILSPRDQQHGNMLIQWGPCPFPPPLLHVRQDYLGVPLILWQLMEFGRVCDDFWSDFNRKAVVQWH